jgi:O-antigen/teichoic acid export membrane protein
MQGFFFRNLLFLVSVNLIIKPLWIFGIDRSVQNLVGAEEYGVYFVLLNFSMLTQILLDFGISHYNNRLIAQHEHLLNKQLSFIFGIKLMLAGVYLLVTMAAAWLLNYSQPYLYLLLLLCFNQLLASMIAYVRSNISALHHFKVDSLFSAMDKTLMVIVCGFLLFIPAWRSQFSIHWFVYAQLFSYAATLMASSLYLLNISGKISLSFSLVYSKELFQNVLPFAILISLMALYSRIDAVMIGKLLGGQGEREAGIYASAFRLIDAFNQFGFLASVLLLPIFSRMISRGMSIENLAASGFVVLNISAFTACAATWFFGQEIMHLLYTEADEYSAMLLRILTLSILGSTTIYVFSTLLTAANQLKALIAVALAAVVFNVTANYWLIPSFKALGAAVTSSATQIGIGLIQLFMSARFFRFHFNKKLLLRLGLFYLAAIVSFGVLSRSGWPWMACLILGGILCAGAAFLLKLVEVKKLRALLIKS